MYVQTPVLPYHAVEIPDKFSIYIVTDSIGSKWGTNFVSNYSQVRCLRTGTQEKNMLSEE